MANPLQDQLLKAGLVSKDKLNKSNKRKHQQAKQQPKHQASEAERLKQQVKQAALEKAERDRVLNQQRLDDENKKAIAAQIRQLVEMNAVSNEGAETAYNFDDGGKVKSVYVTAGQRQQIANGRLAVVRLGAGYKVIPTSVAEKIIQRDARVVVVYNEPAQANEVDDEYAEFKVPDDLMW
ncbi:MAG: DUF2058 domain-containing protein [Gammaproteobacteria bacterium]